MENANTEEESQNAACCARCLIYLHAVKQLTEGQFPYSSLLSLNLINSWVNKHSCLHTTGRVPEDINKESTQPSQPLTVWVLVEKRWKVVFISQQAESSKI